jgi:hypothetical protein
MLRIITESSWTLCTPYLRHQLLVCIILPLEFLPPEILPPEILLLEILPL